MFFHQHQFFISKVGKEGEDSCDVAVNGKQQQNSLHLMELRHNGLYILLLPCVDRIVLPFHQNCVIHFNKLCNFYCAKNRQFSSQRDKLGCASISNNAQRVGAACVGSTVVGPETWHRECAGKMFLQALSKFTKWSRNCKRWTKMMRHKRKTINLRILQIVK